MDSKVKGIIIVAALLLLALGGFGAFMFFSKSGGDTTAENPGMVPAPPPAQATPVEQPPLLMPPAPPMVAPLASVTGAVPDPFEGGPARPRAATSVVTRRPPEEIQIPLQEFPPVLPLAQPSLEGVGGVGGETEPVLPPAVEPPPPVIPPNPFGAAPTVRTTAKVATAETRPDTRRARTLEDLGLGRHAGWIYTGAGQIAAVFETNQGAARALSVGDTVGQYRVMVLTADGMTLAHTATGQEIKIKLQSTETYRGPVNR